MEHILKFQSEHRVYETADPNGSACILALESRLAPGRPSAGAAAAGELFDKYVGCLPIGTGRHPEGNRPPNARGGRRRSHATARKRIREETCSLNRAGFISRTY